jgi:hypothetical protein
VDWALAVAVHSALPAESAEPSFHCGCSKRHWSRIAGVGFGCRLDVLDSPGFGQAKATVVLFVEPRRLHCIFLDHIWRYVWLGQVGITASSFTYLTEILLMPNAQKIACLAGPWSLTVLPVGPQLRFAGATLVLRNGWVQESVALISGVVRCPRERVCLMIRAPVSSFPARLHKTTLRSFPAAKLARSSASICFLRSYNTSPPKNNS